MPPVPEHPDARQRSDGWLWQRGFVIRDADGAAWLDLPDPAQCERCRRGRGCGGATFLRLFRRLEAHPAAGGRIRLPLDPARAGRFADGAEVNAGIDGRWLLGAATRLYLIPLTVFVGGLWLVAKVDALNEPLMLAVATALGGGALVLAGRGGRPPALALEAGSAESAVGLESTGRCCHVSHREPD